MDVVKWVTRELSGRPDGSGIETEALSHVSRFGASRELRYKHVPCRVSHKEQLTRNCCNLRLYHL